ncbi:MAG: hypothetical protein J6B79_04480 [Clostridia bacterium]|nr:hypothetical protein [Clostridia bacterium]
MAKGLMNRLIMGKDNLPDFTPDKLPGSRFAVFKDVFFNRIGAMAKISLLCLLFMLPAIAWIFFMSMTMSVDSSIIPYSSNLGIGYPVITNAALIGEYRTFMYNVRLYSVLIPLLMIAGVGFAGAFHVMKMLAWGEGVAVGTTFFQGVKKNWFRFIWIFFYLGISLFVLMFNITGFNALGYNMVLKVIALVLAIIQFVIMLFMMLWLCTQEVTYKLKAIPLIRNSFLFTIALAIQTLFIMVLCALPILLLMLIPLQFGVFLWLIFIVLGPAYIILIWTVYSQWAFDRFVNDKVKGAVKNRGMYVKNPETEKQSEIERIKARNTQYGAAYVSRRLSSIDDGKTFTPLATNFSRSDLMKMNEEKAQMREEIDREKAEVDAQLEEEMIAYEEQKAAEKKNKKKKKNADKPQEMVFVEYKKKKKKKPDEDEIATIPVSEEEYVDEDNE